MIKKITVKFLPEGKCVSVLEGSTILDAVLEAGVDLSTLCGRKGVCGKCQVVIAKGELTPLTEFEYKHIPREKLELNYRLACQAKLLKDTLVKIPEEARTGKQKLVIMGVEPPVKLEPKLKKVYVELTPPTLLDPKADDLRLLDKIDEMNFRDLEISYETMLKLPTVLRKGEWKATATLYDNEIVNIEPGDTRRKLYGFAVDIGSTKVAGFFVDLNTGKLVHARGTMNPQMQFGEDVMSRISFAMQNHDGTTKLQKAIVGCINDLIDKACGIVGIDSTEISEVTIVGNTAMHHLFLGVDTEHVGLCPYSPVIKRPVAVKSKKLGISINPEGYVFVAPNIAGFIGADHVAGILATQILSSDELSMFIDVGTNTEIGIGNRERFVACSTASGPAFEGAHIRFGMRAATGAIERVRIDSETLEPELKTIDDAKPRGICGSGIIDVIAEMLKSGVIDTTGRIRTEIKHPRVRNGPQGPEFVLVWKDETASGQENIVISQQDVREIQKAKAAIHTGWEILTKTLNVKKEELRRVFIAGAFGSYIDPESAITIGMLPEVYLDIVKFVGNTAGSGARLILKSKDMREEANKVASDVEYLELAAHPEFEEAYINSLYLPHSRIEEYPNTIKKIKAPIKVRNYKKRNNVV